MSRKSEFSYHDVLTMDLWMAERGIPGLALKPLTGEGNLQQTGHVPFHTNGTPTVVCPVWLRNTEALKVFFSFLITPEYSW